MSRNNNWMMSVALSAAVGGLAGGVGGALFGVSLGRVPFDGAAGATTERTSHEGRVNTSNSDLLGEIRRLHRKQDKLGNGLQDVSGDLENLQRELTDQQARSRDAAANALARASGVSRKCIDSACCE